MADERKRKLEELRRKKKQLLDMVKQKESSDPAKESSSKRVDTESTIPESPSPSNPISTKPSFTSTHKKTNSLLADSSKNKRLLEIHIKKLNEALRTSKSEHFLQGIHPDVKTEETQYVLPEEFEEKRKEEELLKQQMEQSKKVPRFARKASIGGFKEVQ